MDTKVREDNGPPGTALTLANEAAPRTGLLGAAPGALRPRAARGIAADTLMTPSSPDFAWTSPSG